MFYNVLYKLYKGNFRLTKLKPRRVDTPYNGLKKRLRLKGILFSGFRYIKRWGFNKLKYMKE